MIRYTKDQIEKLKEEMRKAPKIEKKKLTNDASKAEAIRLLSPEIRRMQKRGYTLTEIREFLGKHGMPVSKPTLATYLNRAGKASDEATERNLAEDTEAKPVA